VFPVEGYLHLEVEQSIHPDLRRRLAADRHFHLRTRRAILAPARRHTHHYASALQSWDIFQGCQGLRGAPAQRMVNFARIDHGLQPRALLSRALDRHQKRQQVFAVACPGVLLQRLAERQMLRLRLHREPGRVGRQECKRRVFVLPVLGKIEVYAAHEVPGGMATFEELLHREIGCSQFGIEGRIDAMPQVGQQGGCQVFCAGHRRNS